MDNIGNQKLALFCWHLLGVLDIFRIAGGGIYQRKKYGLYCT